MRYEELNRRIKTLAQKSGQIASAAEKTQALMAALDVASELVAIFEGDRSLSINSEDALEDIISANTFQNVKVQQWFSFHPYYPDERLALNYYENDLAQVKFYWLNDNSTKARISAGVMISPNWEDAELTRNDSYKIGVDFFLKKDASAVIMVVSNGGNLRVMEFSDRLTHTQVEILDKIYGAFGLASKESAHGVIWSSMALSEVNRKFYEGIAKYFAILQTHLIRCGKTKNDSKMFSSRLMGRLLFVWFLRKKGVIHNDEKYFPSRILDSSKYYNEILKKLFFETLNTPTYDRKTDDLKTPYLNGGLFDAHENDWRFEDIDFPENYFNLLFEHLNRYNFTTDESSPDYEQVAIDPEMLGRVFESLLAEQTTDTGEQARKAKGAFYTPREVVSYMCAESLRQYLYTQFPDDKYKAGIDKLIDTPDYAWETAHTNAKQDLWPFENTVKFIPKVIGALDSLTVLDPACGSGAFPMGMLQLLTRTYERLDSRFDPYITKLGIIQNSIFGVDIEPMAVEIARLRAWLAIIVDDEGEIDPLPNLDFKFVCADSLVPLERAMNLYSDPMLQEKMAMIRSKFFNAKKPEMKEKYKRDYYKLTSSVGLLQDRRECQLKSFDPFKNQRPAEFFDSSYMFGVELFDVIIGNPPYVHLEKMKDVARVKYKPLGFSTYEPRGDLYCLFIENSTKLLKSSGVMSFITSNKWMRSGYGSSLRSFISKKLSPIILIDLGGGVFESATVDTDILVARREEYAKPTKTVSLSGSNRDINVLKGAVDSGVEVFFDGDQSWTILSEIESSIKKKVEAKGVPLSKWGVKVNRGILTGCNEAFLISSEERQEILDRCQSDDERDRTRLLMRPIVRGRNTSCSKINPSGQYLIAAHNGYKLDSGEMVPRINIDLYPAVKAHIDNVRQRILARGGSDIFKRSDQGATPYNLRNCAYMDDFSKPKLVYPETTNSANFVYDCTGVMIDKTCYIMSGKNLEFVRDILSSSLFEFAFRKFYADVTLGKRGYQYGKDALLRLPVLQPTIIDREIDDWVFDMYNMTPEERSYILQSLSLLHSSI